MVPKLLINVVGLLDQVFLGFKPSARNCYVLEEAAAHPFVVLAREITSHHTMGEPCAAAFGCAKAILMCWW